MGKGYERTREISQNYAFEETDRPFHLPQWFWGETIRRWQRERMPTDVHLYQTVPINYGLLLVFEKDTFVLNSGHEAGIPHHFFDEHEIRTLLAKFKVKTLSVGESGRHWQVVGEKR